MISLWIYIAKNQFIRWLKCLFLSLPTIAYARNIGTYWALYNIEHLQDSDLPTTTCHFSLTYSNKTSTWWAGKRIQRRKKNCSYTGTGMASSRASTPGSSLPSNNSKLAPPPVDMWLITLATPTFSTAATESPPPMMVVTPFPLSSASFFAIACKQEVLT